MHPKGFSRWKIGAILLGSIAFACAVFVVCVWKLADRRYVRTQQAVQEATDRLLIKNQMRPVLHGISVPGDANEDYRVAEARILAIGFHVKLRHGLDNLSPLI